MKHIPHDITFTDILRTAVRTLRFMGCVSAICASAALLLPSCNGGKAEADSGETDMKGVGTTSGVAYSKEGKDFVQILNRYEETEGKEHVATADKIFDLMDREEMTDSRITVTGNTPADSMDMMVWYWAGEYLWATQDYAEGLRYAAKALPLTYRLGDLALQSDCERLVGLFHFRQSDYQKAIAHVSKSLEISKKEGDKSRAGSSLNTLAGICLTAKQLDDGEKYILEAIRYCEEANDSNLLPIRYGMASEVCHAKGEDVRSLDYARRAYHIDSLLGKTARMGIRLSQMAAAQIALKQDAEAERSLTQAMPILEKAGNEVSLSICRNQMGELLNRRGDHAEAAGYFSKAAESFASRKDKYNESRAQMGLYEALKESNPREAGLHLRRYATLQDSIYQQDMEQAVSQYNVKYKTEELAHRQEQERLEKRVILFGAIALIAVLLLIVVVGVYTGMTRRRNHNALKKLTVMREHFFTNITHEFRTPLTVILGLSRDLQADQAGAVKDKAQSIERQGKALLQLINQLLDISKVKSAVGKADWRNGNVTAYLMMIVESYQDLARRRDILLHYHSGGKVMMDFVPDYMNKVMNNLLSNAFKFTPENGKIRVASRQDGNRLRIDVSDTGKGMDRETMTHIFEPFYQAESDSRQMGTGVGLALVKQIMDAVEGSITVESEAGKGTVFHLYFPIRNEVSKAVGEMDNAADAALPAEGEPMPADSGGDEEKCRLLIIEDNSDIAAYIGSQFADRYAISYAANGEEGLDKALQLVPDLIITDLMMPGMDGLEVCRQVRANDIINHIPIIIVTAKITEEDRIRGLEAGADAYLTKPFNEEELHTRVEKLLEVRRLMQEKYARIAAEQGVEEKQDPQENVNVASQFLSKVSDIIYMHISKNKSVDVTLIATSLSMSTRQFHRKMVALTGCTPSAYIQRIKIKKAKTLLDGNPKMSLSIIASKSGFSDYSSFVRAFKNVCGITPTEYKRRDP